MYKSICVCLYVREYEEILQNSSITTTNDYNYDRETADNKSMSLMCMFSRRMIVSECVNTSYGCKKKKVLITLGGEERGLYEHE